MTNGDQTDTVYEGMDHQLTFEQSLRSREFEPDGPNYTPRISGVMHVENGKFSYAMSILKSNNEIRTHATVIHLHMRMRLPVRDILFILINAMEIHFQASRESQNW